MSNFREIIRSLDQAGAAREVEHASALVAGAVELLGAAGARGRAAAAASAWSEANRGAAARTLAALREELAKIPRPS
jgi:3-deoxy-D-manno-octulosonic-acid transferase